MSSTKDNFSIEKLEVKDHTHCYEITVEWFSTDPDLGTLGKYTRAIQVVDKEALEKFEEEEYQKSIKDIWDFELRDDGMREMVRKVPCSYDLGLQKFIDVRGADIVQEIGPQKYKYGQYVSKCMIVEACIQQLHEMKDKIDSGFCKWTDFPKQGAAFRSGDPYHDFIGVIETLDRFWD